MRVCFACAMADTVCCLPPHAVWLRLPTWPLPPACRSGYDGKKVDVWASGVLLFVMLLGMFPFEMEDESYVNTAGLYSIW